MGSLLVRRLASSLAMLVFISVLIFGSTEALPGDVATQLLGREATPVALAALRTKLHLNEPAWKRYLTWAGGIVRGDLGRSLATDQPVAQLIGQRLRNTVLIAGLAAAFGIPLALLLGVLAGLKRDGPVDIIISVAALLGVCLPEFVVGTLLILVFGIYLHVVPAVTTASVDAPISQFLPSLWLPAATLSVVILAWIARIVRTSVIDVLDSDYVEMATLKGLSRWRVVIRHAVPNALLPAVNAVSLTLIGLVGGVVIVESVFNYPGIGTLAVQAVQNRDLPVVQAVGLLGAAIAGALNLAADVASILLNPRLRTLAHGGD